MIENLYKKRDIEALDTYFLKHLSAMTAEELNSKSHIAAELAYRDERIDELEAANDLLQGWMHEVKAENAALTAQNKVLREALWDIVIKAQFGSNEGISSVVMRSLHSEVCLIAENSLASTGEAGATND